MPESLDVLRVGNAKKRQRETAIIIDEEATQRNYENEKVVYRGSLENWVKGKKITIDKVSKRRLWDTNGTDMPEVENDSKGTAGEEPSGTKKVTVGQE